MFTGIIFTPHEEGIPDIAIARMPQRQIRVWQDICITQRQFPARSAGLDGSLNFALASNIHE
jgi:hypothetical protein